MLQLPLSPRIALGRGGRSRERSAIRNVTVIGMEDRRSSAKPEAQCAGVHGLSLVYVRTFPRPTLLGDTLTRLVGLRRSLVRNGCPCGTEKREIGTATPSVRRTAIPSPRFQSGAA